MDKHILRFGHRIPDDLYEDYQEADEIYHSEESIDSDQATKERVEELLKRMSIKFHAKTD